MRKFNIYKFNTEDAFTKLPRPNPVIKDNRMSGFGIPINPSANNPKLPVTGWVVSYLKAVMGNGGILQSFVTNQL